MFSLPYVNVRGIISGFEAKLAEAEKEAATGKQVRTCDSSCCCTASGCLCQ